MAKFSASDEDSDTNKIRKRLKNTKERDDNVKKLCKNSTLYCSIHGGNNSHTSRERKVHKARYSDKDKSKYGKKDYKKKFKDHNLLQAQADQQKYRYEKINKAFTKKKTFSRILPF